MFELPERLFLGNPADYITNILNHSAKQSADEWYQTDIKTPCGEQIMGLRKMQMPIKDILRIYESEDMSTVVEVFVDRINAIDEETNALAELKRIVSEFLQTMIQNGITKISAIPLLYEEMDK